MVSAVGFEPTVSCFQGRRIDQAFPHAENVLVVMAGVEPATDSFMKALLYRLSYITSSME